MSKKKSSKEYIESFKKVHGNDTYDYSLVNNELCKSNKSKIPIICHCKNTQGIEHGTFYQIINNHMTGNGCPKCKIDILKLVFKIKINDLIKEFEQIYGIKKYDYSLINEFNYKNNRSIIPIICHKKDKKGIEHGLFHQMVSNHKSNHSCPKCARERIENARRNSFKEVIKELEELYKNKNFDFSLITEENYKNVKTKLPIICKDHGVFYKNLNLLRSGTYCPECNINSLLELKAKEWLINNNFLFEPQKKFDNCRGLKNCLPFDFYLIKENTCIELDGRQHFEPVQFGGIKYEEAIKNFETTKKNDNTKNEFCINNDIDLIRISYKNFKNIDKILSQKLLGV